MRTLATSKVRLMVKALTTQFNSIRPLSMNLSSRASTRTSTARFSKERGAAMGRDGDQIEERGRTFF